VVKRRNQQVIPGLGGSQAAGCRVINVKMSSAPQQGRDHRANAIMEESAITPLGQISHNFSIGWRRMVL
jgi:hypothetical protein